MQQANASSNLLVLGTAQDGGYPQPVVQKIAAGRHGKIQTKND
tara:strand:+ start:301 stop:429 length:129 start_codon:yes stop_codon:yes gene_type:complete